ncbi:MAG: hypothetical protein E7163_00715 [Firmicutes bacterium]|nr:hypothetical protein [Bacillota bacterium]
MSKVVLISPPYMKLSYPNYEMPIALTKGCDYMNPGLLISTSILTKNNISNKIIKITNPSNKNEVIQSIDFDTIFVGISCTCSWEYLEALKIAEIIKNKYPKIKIALSGWQVKSIKEKVFLDSENIDYIILGDAEYTIENLYKKIINNSNEQICSVIEKNNANKNNFYKSPKIEFEVIDFRLFPNYDKYIPYVEESRNCPYSCEFCLNSCVVDKYQIVPFEIFVQNVELLEKIYGPDAKANLLAANFGVNSIETQKKLEYLKTKKIKWNIELHVDNNWEYYINDLRAAGIVKVSIGFESGSLTTLRLMNKTKNPENYLIRLKELLNRLNEQGIKPSLNLLIDYRDNIETIKETLLFLEEHRNQIHKVKANFMFGFGDIINNIDYDYLPNIIIDEYGKKIHAYPVLPNNLTLKEISVIINKIENGDYSTEYLDNIQGFKKKLKL